MSTKKLTTEEFINRVKEIHGNKYDYSNVNYINSKTKVCIICLEHGEFWQTPINHLQGKGCPECGGTKKIEQNQFINKAKLIHGDKYDYSKIEYKGIHKKVCIICPEHGEFWQTSSSHLKGNGCPICNESKLERQVALFLDENGVKYERQKKFKWLGKQSLDFYLPEYNIAIECQGEQHFKPIEHFGGIDKFLDTQKNDFKKFKLCKSNLNNIIYYSNIKEQEYFSQIYDDLNKILKKYGKNRPNIY